MPHQTKESTSTAPSLHSDALSTIASTASSLDAMPTSPLAMIDALTGLPLHQKPGDAPVLPASPTLTDDLVALDQSTYLPLQDHMATAELSRPVAVVDARPNEEPKRKSPPLAPKKKTHFADGFARPEGGQTNAADAQRMKSPVIVELSTNVIVRTSTDVFAARMLIQPRLKTNTASSPHCHPTSQHVTSAHKAPS